MVVRASGPSQREFAQGLLGGSSLANRHLCFTALRKQCAADGARQNVLMKEVASEERLFRLTLDGEIPEGGELLWDYGYRPQY